MNQEPTEAVCKTCGHERAAHVTGDGLNPPICRSCQADARDLFRRGIDFRHPFEPADAVTEPVVSEPWERMQWVHPVARDEFERYNLAVLSLASGGFVPSAEVLAEAMEAKAALINAICAEQSAQVEALPADLRGDGPCGDCGTLDNIVWFAPSEVWNAATEPTIGHRYAILCIPCFVKRAHEAGMPNVAWRLAPENVADEVQVEALREALAWARSEILDRSEHESSSDDYPVPDHECGYYVAPDGGACSWCERWAVLNAALAGDRTQEGTR